MSFDFWAVANNTEFQNQAVAENKSGSGEFKKFTRNGEYNLTINRAEIRQTKAGDQKLTLRVQADSGESGFWDLLVGHGGGRSQAAKIAQQSLALILKYSGAKAANPNALIGLRVKAWVKIEEEDGYSAQTRFRPIGSADGAGAKLVAQAVKSEATVQKVEVAEISDDDIPF